MIKNLLTAAALVAAFFMPARAATEPPPGSYPKQVPFVMICHQVEAALLDGVAKSFGEYISVTAEMHDGEMIFYLLEDPRDKSMSVVMTYAGETCLVFNGEKMERHDPPPVLPSASDEEA